MKLRDAKTVSGIGSMATNCNNLRFRSCSVIAATITFFTAFFLNKDVLRLVYLSLSA